MRLGPWQQKALSKLSCGAAEVNKGAMQVESNVVRNKSTTEAVLW